jgi:basic membrane lipoprotein Med (substrate-binding protein (PBP1-ABC) superfamily)
MWASLSRRGVLAAGAGLASAVVVRPAQAGRPLRVAAICTEAATGPAAGPWAGRIHRALQDLEAGQGLRCDLADRVAHADVPEALRQAAGGVDLVVADVFGAEDAARLVAREFPGTAFLLGSSFGPDAGDPNVAVFDRRIDEACYLAGVLAGGVTRAGRVGVVAGYPLHGVNRLIHAFAAGLRRARPGTLTEVAFTGSWADEPGAAAQARKMIARGADVVFGERPGACHAAAEFGAVAIGCGTDAAVASADWDARGVLHAAVARCRDGRFGPEDLGGFASLAQGGCGLALHDADRVVSDAAYSALRLAEAELRAGAVRLASADYQPADSSIA